MDDTTLNVLAIHIGFMLLIFAGQYLWLYLFPSLPDFLTADSGQRYSASLYVLIGLILLISADLRNDLAARLSAEARITE
jgi:hypothetical protein